MSLAAVCVDLHGALRLRCSPVHYPRELVQHKKPGKAALRPFPVLSSQFATIGDKAQGSRE